MDLTEEQKEIISSKVGDYNCPLCSGKMIHYTQPFQLVCVPSFIKSDEPLDIKRENLYEYLCGECQNCGYTILRRLSILLGNKDTEEHRDYSEKDAKENATTNQYTVTTTNQNTII